MFGRRIRVGVIGVGHLGQHHARVFAESSMAELIGVCDLDAPRVASIAKKHNTQAFTDYRELLAKVDAVSIVTPTIAHHQIGRDMLHAGIHCLVEKPICTTVQQARELSTIAAERGLVLQVGHIEHFNVAVQKFKKYLTQPLFIKCDRLGPFNPRVQDVGVVMDLMIHDIDIILRIVNSPIKEIKAVGAAILSDKEDIADARIEFENGVIANVTCSRVTPKTMRKLRVYQADASYISLDYRSQTMEIHQRVPRDNPRPGEPRYSIETKKLRVKRKEPLKLELEHFLTCVNDGRVPQTTGTQATEALDIVIQITEILRATSVPVIEKSIRGGNGTAASLPEAAYETS